MEYLLQAKGYTWLTWESILAYCSPESISVPGTGLIWRLNPIPVRGLNLHMLARPIL